MDRELLSFNIRLNNETSISDLLKIASSLFETDNFISVFYEFNADIEKCIYKDKRFKKFQNFLDFYYSNQYRFDMLKFETDNEQIYLGFQQSRGDLRVFGRTKNRFVFDKIMGITSQSVLYAYLHNSIDILLSRTNKTRSWKRRLGYIPEYITTYRNPRFESGERDEFLIDLESCPTHQHFLLVGDRLWFGACAEMYFSDTYNKHILTNNWNDFEDCKENEMLSSGLRKIRLYENFEEFEKPENRERQWNFRKQLSIDEIANRLKKTKHNNGNRCTSL